MPNHDPRIDAYIAKSSDFAKPILNRVRKLVHKACPDVEETLKWNAPHFLHQGILVAMPAFKQHCALIFWKGRLFLDRDRKMKLRRLTSLSDLPSDKVLMAYLKQAIKLNTDGVKAPARSKASAKKPVVVPGYFLTALKKNKKALAAFGNFPPSHKREYVDWIVDAKREETRARRIKTALEWLAKGKSRNWKYQNC